jgi:A/G-specific adenine glycosylase
MELGATLCTPRAPACPRCPLAGSCRAAAAGRPEAFPPPRRRAAPVREEQVAAVVERKGRFLLVRRGPDETQLAGLWEFPTVAAGAAAEDALAARYGGRWRLAGERARVRHGITVRALTVVARAARLAAAEGVAERGEAGFFGVAEAAGLGLTGVARKLLARLAAG